MILWAGFVNRDFKFFCSMAGAITARHCFGAEYRFA